MLELLAAFRWIERQLKGRSVYNRVYHDVVPLNSDGTENPRLFPAIVYSDMSGGDVPAAGTSIARTEPRILIKIVHRGGGIGQLENVMREIHQAFGADNVGEGDQDGYHIRCWRKSPLITSDFVNGVTYRYPAAIYQFQISRQ